LCHVFKSLGECSTDEEIALGYYKQAQEQDSYNEGLAYSMLKRYISAKKTDEARLLVKNIVTDKIPNSELTLLPSILKYAMRDKTEDKSLSTFMAIIMLSLASPECWTDVESGMETAIQNARDEGKEGELAALLLHLGIARYYFRQEGSKEELKKAVANWQDCLLALRGKVNKEERFELVEQRAINYLSMAYFEQPSEVSEDLFNSTGVSSTTRYVLASHSISKGEHSNARDLLRSEMTTALHILSDDSIGNDWYGYTKLRQVLGHVGDYENAAKASFLISELKFDIEVLKALLATTESASLDHASTKIFEFYQTGCLDSDSEIEKLQKVLNEINRLSGESTDENDENVSRYKKISDILAPLVYMDEIYYTCNNCNRKWDNEIPFHICKRCYSMDLCDACWNDLQSIETKIFICSKSHSWWDLEAWDMERYLLAFKRLVPMKAEDGRIEFVTSSKWLGSLCEQWGMSRADWKFE
jgi:hypothetical protein